MSECARESVSQSPREALTELWGTVAGGAGGVGRQSEADR
jgi:hypothetical protein